MTQKNQLFLVLLLTMTAGILTAVLLMTLTADVETARADTPVSGGNYIVNTGAISTRRDLLYIINRERQALHVYGLDLNDEDVKRVESVDLRGAFGRPDAD